MKLPLIIALFILFASISLGQTPEQSSSPEKSKTFGSSLEKYKNRGKKDSQSNPQNGESNNEEVIQVKTSLVVNDVLVTDQNGNIVNGLTKDDFIVTEDNVPQNIEMFSFGENVSSPRSIVIIIDTGVTQLPYLKNSIQAAKILIDKLRPNDKMAIVSDNLKLLADFTQNKALLKEALDSITVKYSELTTGREFTNLLAVLNEMFSAEDRHRIIISQGSGNGIFSIKTDDETLPNIYKSLQESRGFRGNWKKDIEFNDIEESIEKSRATIYSIIPGIQVLGLSKKEQFSRAGKSFGNILYEVAKLRGQPRLSQPLPYFLQDLESKRLNFVQTAMFKVATLSGGYTSFLEKPQDAEIIYSNIFNEFNNRYSIGYYPTNQEQSGNRRTVKIEVRNHPEYKILGRKTYIPEN